MFSEHYRDSFDINGARRKNGLVSGQIYLLSKCDTILQRLRDVKIVQAKKSQISAKLDLVSEVIGQVLEKLECNGLLKPIIIESINICPSC